MAYKLQRRKFDAMRGTSYLARFISGSYYSSCNTFSFVWRSRRFHASFRWIIQSTCFQITIKLWRCRKSLTRTMKTIREDRLVNYWYGMTVNSESPHFTYRRFVSWPGPTSRAASSVCEIPGIPDGPRKHQIYLSCSSRRGKQQRSRFLGNSMKISAGTDRRNVVLTFGDTGSNFYAAYVVQFQNHKHVTNTTTQNRTNRSQTPQHLPSSKHRSSRQVTNTTTPQTPSTTNTRTAHT